MSRFPELVDWSETRDTLHVYSKFLGAVRGRLAEPHPLWWHISLEPVAEGLTTGTLEPEAGAAFALTLDLQRHALRLDAGGTAHDVADLRRAPAARELGERALAALAERGVSVEPERERWADESLRSYARQDAEAYRRALAASAERLAALRRALHGERSPVQLWPHHFDLSLEWLAERSESYEEDGETKQARAQIGFGFSPGDDNHPEAYYYATPWPFDEALAAVELPPGGRWLIEPWKGALLPYAAVAGGDGEPLTRFFETVYREAAPALGG